MSNLFAFQLTRLSSHAVVAESFLGFVDSWLLFVRNGAQTRRPIGLS